MTVTVADIINLMEIIAPSFLAEKWDNAGLQVGQRDWPVRTIWVALDPLPEVVAAACKKDADLLITHHPLIFQPLKSIDFKTPVGSVVHMAIMHRMAVYASHTNLDNAKDGLNDILASLIGLQNLNALEKAGESENYKLVVYVPVEYERKFLDSIFKTNAGKIGTYKCCSFRNRGTGTFRPGPLANQFAGKTDEISNVDEIRIETVARKNDLVDVIEHLRKNHPYETMAYDVYPLLTVGERQGIGRVGVLAENVDLASFALGIKEKLGLKYVKVAGKPDLAINKVAICTGSGSGLMDKFFSSGAQVYVSGDLRYHDARAVEAAGLGLIDIGHFASEHLIVDALATRLRKILSERGVDINVEACELENDPFVIL